MIAHSLSRLSSELKETKYQGKYLREFRVLYCKIFPRQISIHRVLFFFFFFLDIFDVDPFLKSLLNLLPNKFCFMFWVF